MVKKDSHREKKNLNNHGESETNAINSNGAHLELRGALLTLPENKQTKTVAEKLEQKSIRKSNQRGGKIIEGFVLEHV